MALIDREELLKTLDSYELTKWYHGDLITIIFDAPTVDAVEVVRCKDCKYYNKHLALEPFCEYLTDKLGYCDEAVYMQDDDFCSYGKCGGD